MDTSRLRNSYVGYLLLALALSIPAFWNLSGGELREWDEGLALRHTQNAVHFNSWLTPTSNTGEFSRAFTKPPFLIWQTALGLVGFQWSALGARSGTAAALVLTGLICAALGRQLGLNRWLSGAWAFAVVLSGGALRWGHEVNIEISLVMFSLLSLYCYGQAITGRSNRWALAAGAALCGAFLTKQMVCGLPALAIVVTELLVFRRADWKTSALRLGTTGGIPTLLAAAWALQANAQSRGRVVRSMVEFTIVKRINGLPGGQHFNFLNRLAFQLSEAMAPFPWEFGVLGLALLWYRLASRRPVALVLVTLYGLFAIALYDFGTRSVLPWYSWSVAVPLLLGIGHLVARVIEEGVHVVTVALAPQVEVSRLKAPSPEAALGVAAILLACSTLWQHEGSRLNLLLACLVVAIIAVLALRSNLAPRARGFIVGAALLLPGLLLVYALALRPKYWTDPGPLFALMKPIGAGQKIAVSSELASPKQTNLYAAVFGPKSQVVSNPPWRRRNGDAFQAYVERFQLPTEFKPRKGVTLHRSQGIVAWQGALAEAPVDNDAMAPLLRKGALTFEAEEGTSDQDETFTHFDGALVRHLVGLNSDRYRARSTTLMKIETPPLPAGSYEVTVHLASRCDKRRRAPVGDIRMSLAGASRSTSIPCKDSDMHRVTELLKAGPAGRLKVEVKFTAGELWVDKVEVRKK